jgi:TolA-binding protein
VRETVKKPVPELNPVPNPMEGKVNRERDKKLQKTEQQIESTEDRLKILENELAETNYQADNYNDLLNQYNQEKMKLERLMEEWEKLAQ